MTAPTLASYYSESEDDGRFYADPFRVIKPGTEKTFPKYETHPSVTTLLKMEAKDMSWWKVQMALKEVLKSPDQFFQRSDQDFLRHYQGAADRFRDDRAAIGTAVHEVIEAELTGSWEIPDVYDPEVAQCVDQWHRFLNEHEVKPLYVETTVINRTLGYMGTADFVGWIDGEFGVGDVKTSRSTHESHHVQLSGLAKGEVLAVQVPQETEGAFEFVKERTVKGEKRLERAWFLEVEMPESAALWLIHLRPDERDPLTGKYVPAFQKLIPSEIEKLDLRFEVLKGYRQTWGAVKALEAYDKAKEKEAA